MCEMEAGGWGREAGFEPLGRVMREKWAATQLPGGGELAGGREHGGGPGGHWGPSC